MADIEIIKINGTKVGDIADKPTRDIVGEMPKKSPYVICTTAGATQAKEVTIQGFELKEGTMLAVLFTYGFVAANPTLNISGTGAKAIKCFGVALPNYKVKNNTIVTMNYDGTDWNVVNIEYPGDVLTGNYVDLGLPSGVKWAKKSIDLTQNDHFAASEFQYECTFFSWGNKEGYNPTSTSAFSYDWGTSNDGPYASTMGAKLTGNIPLSQDTARAALGNPWRMPTTEEFVELINNCDFIDANGNVIGSGVTDKRVTVNGIVGIYLQSKINGNRIFFACSGDGNGTSWYSRGSNGHYWSGSVNSTTDGRNLFFYSGGVGPQDDINRFYGFAVRPVQ